jgi:acetyl-CoA carboxylase carboxyl transferase subunit alpha
MPTFLDFEKPLAELDARVNELRDTAQAGALNIDPNREAPGEVGAHVAGDLCQADAMAEDAGCAASRRPHFKDYVAGLVEEFVPLSGDRSFGDDHAIVGGLGKLKGRKIMLIRP